MFPNDLMVKIQFELDRMIYHYKTEPPPDLAADSVAVNVLDALPAMGKQRRRLFWIGYLLGMLRLLRAKKDDSWETLNAC